MSDKYKSLIQHLLRPGAYEITDGGLVFLMKSAADAVAELQVENERLRDELHDARTDRTRSDQDAKEAQSTAISLRAEVEQLTDALAIQKGISDGYKHFIDERDAQIASLQSCEVSMREALEDSIGLIELYAAGDAPSGNRETIDNGDGTTTVICRSSEEAVNCLLEKMRSALAQSNPEPLEGDRYDPMPIDAAPGTIVYWAWPQNGYHIQGARAHEIGLFPLGGYTVERTEIHQSSTTLYLREFPGELFNTVQFGVRRPVQEGGKQS